MGAGNEEKMMIPNKINNKVAWRMASTIAEREQDQGKSTPDTTIGPSLSTAAKRMVPVYGWLLMNDGMRHIVARTIVDARLMGGLGIILSFWVLTGAYMLFTECVLWAKGRLRSERKVITL